MLPSHFRNHRRRPMPVQVRCLRRMLEERKAVTQRQRAEGTGWRASSESECPSSTGLLFIQLRLMYFRQNSVIFIVYVWLLSCCWPVPGGWWVCQEKRRHGMVSFSFFPLLLFWYIKVPRQFFCNRSKQENNMFKMDRLVYLSVSNTNYSHAASLQFYTLCNRK